MAFGISSIICFCLAIMSLLGGSAGLMVVLIIAGIILGCLARGTDGEGLGAAGTVLCSGLGSVIIVIIKIFIMIVAGFIRFNLAILSACFHD